MEKSRIASSEAKIGNKNPQWKGKNVGYAALHLYMKRKIVKPKKCNFCGKNDPYDLANISGNYLRDISDWLYLCRSCHMKSDGRLFALQEARKSVVY
jgi:hypothetical protein